MSKKLFSALPNFNSTNLNVDRENGILKNTCIAMFGENKNESYFDELFLADLVKLGNQNDGIKSRFGHPNMCGNAFGSFIGRYKNFRIQDQHVYADLFLDPVTRKTQVEGKGILMFDYIMDMAESNPDMFGNSIHIFSECYEKQIGDKSQVLHKLEIFKACDLVDDPAATDALFSNGNDLGVLVTEFLDQNPQIFSTIETKPEIITDFFERYVNYQNRKSKINFNMNFFERMTKKLAGKKDDAFDVNLTLADGNIVTVVTDANEPQVGDAITDEAGAALADGDYLLPDGGKIVVAAGAISEMMEAEPTPPAEPTMQEVMNSVDGLQKTFNTFAKNFGAIQKQNEALFEDITDKVTALGKNTKSTYQVPGTPPPPARKTGPTDDTYDADKAKEIREKRKNK